MAAIRTRNRKHKNKDRKQTTQKRGEYREEENVFLLEQFNGWFTAACPHHSRPENGGGTWIDASMFCHELLDGVALCQLVRQIDGSRLKKFHPRPKGVFHRRENIVFFVKACRRLKLPVILSISNLEEVGLQTVVTCLLALARIASAQADMIEALPEAIMEKLETFEEEVPMMEFEELEEEEEEEEDTSFAAIHSVSVLAVEKDATPWATHPDGFVQYALAVYILKQTQEGGGVHPHAEIDASMVHADRGRALLRAGIAEHAAAGIGAEQTPDHVVHRRYSEFLAVAALLEQIAKIATGGGRGRKACPHLPAKTWWFHGGGSEERLTGLMEFLELDIFSSSNGIDGGYTAAVKRSRESWPTVLDQQLIGVVRRFLGVEDGWEQLCNPATGKLVPHGLLSIVLESESHDDLDLLLS